MKTNLVTPPVEDAVDVLNMLDHMRVDYADDAEESLIERLTNAAVTRIENLCGRKLITQTWQAFWDYWPTCPWKDRIEIPFGKLQSVTHLKYYDTDDTEATWSSSNYKVDIYEDPGFVVLGYGKSWPSTTLQVVNGIEAQFVCGYGTVEQDIPEDLRLAIRMLVAFWHENREAFALQVGLVGAVEVPEGVYALIEEYRIRGYHRC